MGRLGWEVSSLLSLQTSLGRAEAQGAAMDLCEGPCSNVEGLSFGIDIPMNCVRAGMQQH